MAENFAAVLQALRRERGLTQEALAERAAVGVRTIQGLERGANFPHRGTLQRLMEALELSPQECARFEATAQPSPRRRSPAAHPIRLLPDPLDASSARHNLPAPLTSFVGRESERSEITSLLATARLVTLTGAAGCGKTRLALQIGSDVLDRYPDGVWLIELAPLADPTLVPRTVAAALGIPERPNEPAHSELITFLRTRRCLLVLDNCEHLVDASARFAVSLLQACPHLSILATSRQAFRVAGETQRRILPLPTVDPSDPLPAGEDLALIQRAYPAVLLFVERARAIEPRFALTHRNLPAVAQICWQLDGLPLAIELAAAWIRALPVEQLSERLGNRFRLLVGGAGAIGTRHQTLRAAIDWSHDLLAEPERLLFPRLAVFAGDFPLRAAEGICAGPGLDVDDILPALGRLVDQSLVEVEERGGEARYHLLESIREYAWERLAATEEIDVLRRKHAAWYLSWAQDAETRIWGAEQKVWLDRLELEHDNLRAALRFFRENDVTSGLGLAALLYRFWFDKGHLVEGQRWLEGLLERECKDPLARGPALLALGFLRHGRGNVSGAIPALEEGLAMVRPEGPSRRLFHGLYFLGSALKNDGHSVRAKQLYEESLAVARAIGEVDIQGVAFESLGDLALMEGRKEEARELYRESLSLFRAAESARGIDTVLRRLARLARLAGDDRRARELLFESLVLAWETGLSNGIADALVNLGVLAHRAGNRRRAVRLIAAAARDSLPVLPPRGQGDERDSTLAASRTALGEEAFAAAWAEGQAMTLEQAVRYALRNEPEDRTAE